jgi:hypothetical protein
MSGRSVSIGVSACVHSAAAADDSQRATDAATRAANVAARIELIVAPAGEKNPFLRNREAEDLSPQNWRRGSLQNRKTSNPTGRRLKDTGGKRLGNKRR